MEKILNKKIELPKEVDFVINQLHKHNFKVFLVGGAVRDYLLEKEPFDFDICTSATPKDMLDIFSSDIIFEKKGIPYGSIQLKVNERIIEVTTFRKDGEYIKSRRPKSIQLIDNPEEDSIRRDFTINALYYFDGQIFDFHNGLYDLENKIIKVIGNPTTRFEEDALRIFRALRFSVEFDFEIEETTKQGMIKSIDKLFTLSSIRIEEEISKIFSHPSLFKNMKMNKDIYQFLFPNIDFNNPLFTSDGTSDFVDNLSRLIKSLKYNNNDLTTLLDKYKFRVEIRTEILSYILFK